MSETMFTEQAGLSFFSRGKFLPGVNAREEFAEEKDERFL